MKSWMIFSLALVGLSFNISAIEKGIYGDDDRLDLYQVNNPLLLELARSTAAMIDYDDIDKVSGGYRLSPRTLAQDGICEEAAFSHQIAAASCSGFLVAPDLLVTAGHCVYYNSDCLYNKWVFDYSVSSASDTGDRLIPADKVYRCKEVISSSYTNDNDYALIRLDRAVTDREPLQYRTSGKISNGTPLIIMGHPTGLPLKIAGGAKVKKNSNSDYFVANLDSFGGNSGSAVFNAKTGLVEGILVRGDQDYEWTHDSDGSYCKMPKKCSDSIGLFGNCRGEESTRITNIEELM